MPSKLWDYFGTRKEIFVALLLLCLQEDPPVVDIQWLRSVLRSSPSTLSTRPSARRSREGAFSTALPSKLCIYTLTLPGPGRADNIHTLTNALAFSASSEEEERDTDSFLSNSPTTSSRISAFSPVCPLAAYACGSPLVLVEAFVQSVLLWYYSTTPTMIPWAVCRYEY